MKQNTKPLFFVPNPLCSKGLKKKISKKTGKSLLVISMLFVNHNNIFYNAVIFFCQILNHCHYVKIINDAVKLRSFNLL